jgi:hypothetical protein
MSTSARNHHADRQLHHAGSRAVAPSQRLLRRPTLAETERIARNCPAEGLSVTVIVQAIRRETGCSRSTAYRAVSDAFAVARLTRGTRFWRRTEWVLYRIVRDGPQE